MVPRRVVSQDPIAGSCAKANVSTMPVADVLAAGAELLRLRHGQQQSALDQADKLLRFEEEPQLLVGLCLEEVEPRQL